MQEPANLLRQNCLLKILFRFSVAHDKYVQSLFTLNEETHSLLFDLIKLVATAMIKCIDKQLVDFLPGGKFHVSNEIDVRHTKFAHTTNLAGDHHFGDLGSSQKRRPSASMHHHSSIQLLKRNRKQMVSWLEDMASTHRSSIIKKARKGGRILRELHINNEKSVISTVHDEMMKPKPTKRKRKQKDEIENDIATEFDNLKAELPVINNFITNECCNCIPR